MKHNKAPGPDGFPMEFFLEHINDDLMEMFAQLSKGELPLYK
jgi:hypothetical protein